MISRQMGIGSRKSVVRGTIKTNAKVVVYRKGVTQYRYVESHAETRFRINDYQMGRLRFLSP
jgi:hypothetical protein